MIIKSAIKYMLFLIGTISFVLGIIGVFVPVLPTTPFLLLSSFCYIRSSKRMHNWLIHNKIFGEYIYNYMTYRAVRKSVKIKALLFLWMSLLLSIYIISNLYLDIFLLLIGISVSAHLLSLKTFDA